MTAKEFLSQAAYLDRLINSKLEQLEQLKRITLPSSSVTEIGGGTPLMSKVERITEKICLMEQEIDDDVDRYVDVKREITRLVMQVPDLQQRLLLEQHYLLFLPWEEIADRNFMSLRNVQYLHKKALAALEPKFAAVKGA